MLSHEHNERRQYRYNNVSTAVQHRSEVSESYNRKASLTIATNMGSRVEWLRHERRETRGTMLYIPKSNQRQSTTIVVHSNVVVNES